jgi:membrane-bound ClpP family serine protease
MLITALLAFVAVIGIILWIKSTTQIKNDKKTRVLDLIVIGAILTFVPQFADGDRSLSIAGVLIFSYGVLILLSEKFREGSEEK